MASADDAAPAPDEGAVVATAAEDEAVISEEPVFIERPAPRPDPGNELRSDPAPTAPPAPAPTPAAAAPAASGGGVTTPAAQTTAAATPATLIPARPTEVRGVQIDRSVTATAPSSSASVDLARTGVDAADLAMLAGALLALGALLIGAARPRRCTI